MPIYFEAPIVLLALPVVAFYLYWVWRQTYVNFAPLQQRAMLLARGVVLICLILAAARMGIQRSDGRFGLVFLVDVSASMTQARLSGAEKLVQEALFRKPKDSEVAIVTFAAEPQRVISDAKAPTFSRPQNEAAARETDIARALRYSEGLFPGGMQTRIALISDGRATTGDPIAAAREAKQLGARVSTVLVPTTTADEVWVRELLLPETLRRGEQAELVAVVAATKETTGVVSLQDADVQVGQQTVKLNAGDNSVRFEFRPRSSGSARYTVSVTAQNDTFPENNIYSRWAQVAGDPRVLVLYDSIETTGSFLVEAWRAQGIDVEMRSAQGLRLSAEELAGYDLVVLAEINTNSVDRLVQARIESYVRDMGGGLLIIGGPDGLKGTGEGSMPFGRMFPLGADPRGERAIPRVAMVLALDRSGSMAGDKLKMAKLAALGAVDELGKDGQIGVVAFAADFKWVVEMTPATRKEEIKAQIDSLAAGGGTRIHPALEDAYYKLGAMEATLKHVILLTDGESTDSKKEFFALAERMRNDGITLSTVGLTSESDRGVLEPLAKAGGGQFHYAPTPAEVPKIFTQEAKNSVKEAQKERAVSAKPRRASPLVDRQLLAQAPQLGGHTRAVAKSTADVLVAAETGEPLLGWWRYGLGQAAVWTSDATSRWAQGWINWQGFAPFWTTIARGVMRSSARRELGLQLRRQGSRVTFEVSAARPDGRSLNELDASVVLLDPKGTAHHPKLRQTGPGIYAGDFDLPVAGPYLAKPVASSGETRLEGGWQAVDYPYAQEFAQVTVDAESLQAIATAGGGKHNAKLEDLIVPAETSRKSTSLVSLLLLAALLAFLLDVVLKRVRFASVDGPTPTPGAAPPASV